MIPAAPVAAVPARRYGQQMLLAEEFALLTVDAESGKKTLTGEYYGPALVAC